jgi:hypothetical protein
MTKPPSIEKLAYHEAGHAVIARLLGIGVLKVEILPGGKDGVCDHGHAWPGTDADLAAQAIGLDKDLLMECAGAAAEKYYQPDGDGFAGWLTARRSKPSPPAPSSSSTASRRRRSSIGMNSAPARSGGYVAACQGRAHTS